MTTDLIARQLMRLPLFKRFSLSQLNEIARKGELMLFTPGAIIIQENAEGDAAILIISGEAVRVSGPDLKSRLEPVPAGSLLGESAMLVETYYGSTVVARNEVQALRIGREQLQQQILDDPSIADRIAQNLASRLSRLADELRAVDAVLAGEHGTRMLARPTALASLPAPVH